MWTSALFGAKNFRFFEFYGVSARQDRVEAVRTFFGQGGGGQFFCDVVRTFLMDGL